jgi:TolB-like protein
MKVLKYLCFSMFVTLSLVAASAAQQAAPQKIYQNIQVVKFTIRPSVEFPAEKIDSLTLSVVNAIRGSKKFAQVAVEGSPTETEGETADAPVLKISGEVVKFDKGSRTMRYLVGMGTGKSKLVVNVKFVDAKTGETVLEATVDGDTSHGIFGGDSANVRSEVADEIVKVMKKNFTEPKKKS